MKRSWYIGFFLLSFALLLVTSKFFLTPGYMDAEYYYVNGQQLAQGKGLYQPFLWNYLDNPTGLPHPAFTYWMPLTSLIAAVGLLLGRGFEAARFPFLVVGAGIAPFTAYLGWKLSGNERQAVMAGIFALIPSFYAPYLVTTDAFAIYMLLGGGIILLVGRKKWRAGEAALAGGLAGLMHLARADGLIWLVGVLGFCALEGLRCVKEMSDVRGGLRGMAKLFLASLSGYVLITGFWYGRNLAFWGWITPPGNDKALWLTHYGQIFVFPSGLLTPQSWLASGWKLILLARWDALVNNLQTTLAVQGGIVLLPFTLIGLWIYRNRLEVKSGGFLWLATFGAFTIVFPFAGVYGSFFHSGAALQCLFWAAAPAGIEWAVSQVARWRKWEKGNQVQVFLETLLVITAVLVSASRISDRIQQSDRNDYLGVDQRIVQLGAVVKDRVMVNNPPGYFMQTGRSAVVVPYGDLTMLLNAAEQYQVRFVVVDEQLAPELMSLFEYPADQGRLHYQGTYHGLNLYEIQ